jgi:ABC-type transport system substrate-binding protein
MDREVKSMKKIGYLLTTIMLLSTLSLAAYGAEPSQTPAPQRGGILTIISKNTPVSWGYPADSRGFGDIIAIQPCFEGFLDHDRAGKQRRPMLATAWKLAPDKMSITITLRKGVKFHDGTDFNAEAAKWNLEQYLTNRTYGASQWTSIDVVDDYTVRINLKVFQNTQISNLDSLLMISPTAAKKNGVDWTRTHPVGTGPFKFKSFVRDVSLEYERFDDWWGGKPNLDGIKYRYIADETTALMTFEAGEGLVLEEATAKVANDLKKKGYELILRRGPGMHLVPDSAHPNSIYANKKIREALEYAIDRPKIAARMGYGFWEPMLQPTAPEQFGHVPNLIGRPYDPEKAKKLLSEEGYPNGFTTKIISSSGFLRDPLVAIQGYLREVGIEATFEVVTPAKWNEYRTKGWENALIYCTQGAEDYNYCAYLERYYVPYSINYPSLLKPTELTDLIAQSLGATDLATQAALSQKAVKYFVDEAMAIPLWIEAAVYVLNKSVRDTGYATHGVGFRWDPGKAWLSK